MKQDQRLRPFSIVPDDLFEEFGGAFVFESETLWGEVDPDLHTHLAKHRGILVLDVWILIKPEGIVAVVMKDNSIRYTRFHNPFLCNLTQLLHAALKLRLPKAGTGASYPLTNSKGEIEAIIDCEFTDEGILSKVRLEEGVKMELKIICEALNAKKASEDSPHPKGTAAERHLYRIAQATFSVAWTFLNPKYLPENKELCDFLVLLGDTVIVWQVKGVGLRGKTGRHNPRVVNTNRNQLRGAKRKLRNPHQEIEVENHIWGTYRTNLSHTKEIILVSALLGAEEKCRKVESEPTSDFIHEFDKTDLDILLANLDTPCDFVDYLRKRQKLMEHLSAQSPPSKLITRGEEDLLAHYLQNGDFDDLCGYNMALVNEAPYLESPEHKDQQNRDNGVWDSLILRSISSGNPESEQAQLLMDIVRPCRKSRICFGNGIQKYQNKYLPNHPPLLLWLQSERLDLTFVYIFVAAPNIKNITEFKNANLPNVWPSNHPPTQKTVMIVDEIFGHGAGPHVHLFDITDTIRRIKQGTNV